MAIYNFESLNKHMNGLLYDSICLRYNAARDAEAEFDIIHKHIEPEHAYALAKRDKKRFYELVNEAIGEHD